jgi:hypothetical protein
MSNADSEMKTFLAFTDYTDRHAIEDLSQLIPVQTVEDEPSYITTWLFAFERDWGCSSFEKWERSSR